jgi:hypothetical protein
MGGENKRMQTIDETAFGRLSAVQREMQGKRKTELPCSQKYIPAKFGSVQLHAEHSLSVSSILARG